MKKDWSWLGIVAAVAALLLVNFLGQKRFSLDDVEAKYTFHEVLYEYYDGDVRDELSTYLPKRIDLDDVLNWYGTSREKIARQWIEDNR